MENLFSGGSWHFFSTESLQTLCLSRLINSLECYSPELLSRVPTSLRYRILVQSPIIDICRLERTSAFDGNDSEKLWGECYDKHWFRFSPNYPVTSKVYERTQSYSSLLTLQTERSTLLLLQQPYSVLSNHLAILNAKILMTIGIRVYLNEQ